MKIKPEIEEYILAHTEPEDDILKELDRQTNLKILRPRMLSGHLQGEILKMISYMIKPQNILEIGTFTGYSAICLAKGLSKDGRLFTIDINDVEYIYRNFKQEISNEGLNNDEFFS